MATIAIDGASGIGKSLITTQLSALTRYPAILEGEEGALPNWVLESLTDPNTHWRRTEWFVQRCVRACWIADDVSERDLHCFIDSGPLTSEAYLRFDAQSASLPVQYHIKRLRSFQPDLSVLFLADESFIRSNIQQRSRSSEQQEAVIQRALAVQRQCAEIAKQYQALVIHRDQLDFRRNADLEKLWGVILQHLHSGGQA